MLTKVTWQKGLCLLGSSLIFLVCSSVQAQYGWAKSTKESSTDKGWPTRRVGGGSRQECLTDSSNQVCRVLMALIPDDLVLTASDTPTLSFSVPALGNRDKVRMEFVLRDRQDRLVYETTFTAPVQDGLMGFKLAKTEKFPGLKVGENYHWYLSIIYDDSDRAHDDVVEGWMRYQALDQSLALQLQGATPMEKVELYQRAQLWTEAVSTLAREKENQPHNPQVAQKWSELMEELQLTF